MYVKIATCTTTGDLCVNYPVRYIHWFKDGKFDYTEKLYDDNVELSEGQPPHTECLHCTKAKTGSPKVKKDRYKK